VVVEDDEGSGKGTETDGAIISNRIVVGTFLYIIRKWTRKIRLEMTLQPISLSSQQPKRGTPDAWCRHLRKTSSQTGVQRRTRAGTTVDGALTRRKGPGTTLKKRTTTFEAIDNLEHQLTLEEKSKVFTIKILHIFCLKVINQLS
jgi:hypothetical protein